MNKMRLQDLIERIDDVTELDNEIQDLLPYVKVIAKAYRWIRKKRIIQFLKTLDRVSSFDESFQKRFQEYVLSRTGQELLADYADAVLLTNSKISQSAFALLFADIDCSQYKASFKQMACYSLRGCSDLHAEFFLQLMELPLNERCEVPYATRFIKPNVLEEYTSLQSILTTVDEAIVLVNDLIRRGMLMPDHAGARLTNGNGDWSIVFGVTSTTVMYFELLKKAKAICGSGDD